MAEHVLDLVGTGFFSNGKCTGCAFVSKGHPDSIQRAFNHHHKSEEPFVAPPRVDIPDAADDPLAAKLEQRIIVLLAHKVDFDMQAALYVAVGLAEARSYVLNTGDPRAYVSTLMARIANMSKHQREKLRQPPNRSRRDQQKLMET